jgi:hypothetical protein
VALVVAGVVDESVETAECLDSGGYGLLQSFDIGDVAV